MMIRQQYNSDMLPLNWLARQIECLHMPGKYDYVGSGRIAEDAK